MADEHLIINISTKDTQSPDMVGTIRDGQTRLVRAVPTVLGLCPIIWISHQISKNEQGVPVHKCLLLDSKDPPHTFEGEIELEAFRAKRFPMVHVEW